jgi:hypothetical protein
MRSSLLPWRSSRCSASPQAVLSGRPSTRLARILPNNCANRTPESSPFPIPGGPTGSGLELGHYLAVSLDAALRDYGKDSDKLRVLEHKNIHETVMRPHLPLAAIGSPESRKTIADAGFADVIVYGSLESDETSFKLVFSAENISDGKILVARQVSFPKTSFTYCLTDPLPSNSGNEARKLRTDDHDPHLKIPICVRCPIPDYNDLARRHKLQGTSVFSVLISKMGVRPGFSSSACWVTGSMNMHLKT